MPRWDDPAVFSAEQRHALAQSEWNAAYVDWNAIIPPSGPVPGTPENRKIAVRFRAACDELDAAREERSLAWNGSNPYVPAPSSL